MGMFFMQSWLWMLVFFLIGALIAWLVVRALYRPIDEVRAEVEAGSIRQDGQVRR